MIHIEFDQQSGAAIFVAQGSISLEDLARSARAWSVQPDYHPDASVLWDVTGFCNTVIGRRNR